MNYESFLPISVPSSDNPTRITTNNWIHHIIVSPIVLY